MIATSDGGTKMILFLREPSGESGLEDKSNCDNIALPTASKTDSLSDAEIDTKYTKILIHLSPKTTTHTHMYVYMYVCVCVCM